MLLKNTATKVTGGKTKFITIWTVDKKSILLSITADYDSSNRRASLHALESIT